MQWFFPDAATHEAALSPESRIFEEVETSGQMLAIVIGMQIFWDIPTNIFVKAMWSPLMLTHHVGMLAASVLCLMGPFAQHYVPFYAGVIETSSIPLAFVDLFHPKHYGDLSDTYPAIGQFNLLCRLCFAFLFLVLRALYFPYVTFAEFAPDALSILFEKRSLPEKMATSVGLVLVVLFTGLQLYWARLLCQQAAKLLRPNEQDKQPAMV
uniref:TLC domain-containing protein n=1 Tax=Coccolithus braarudii TaxID=221442 RepID=A0A7S0L7F3_9EUKA|mmetsp:Transcript_24634/g.53129  ORF Transcript_24634/g.53129 Transcript_24634/m.53129 type:complete len:210 (+) Transcript_24634:2-631(+)|eukprot:CAMPEP_0183354862 /NCGR_PEP_ID=MMETSP0164_2-20130417/38382_1 /TAXON_ID=221442 /ORGANISM="Coccolithus pelagicus ssp braarudi, Strain PLY182g" /LENGTH=209 /DNA_ID=CAMNT_0025527825 /DNA_START=1 /DNA_END=630 /DNA_ORIENTATION=-